MFSYVKGDREEMTLCKVMKLLKMPRALYSTMSIGIRDLVSTSKVNKEGKELA